MPDDVLIYHNPGCSTSRKALALLKDAGLSPNVVEYLKTGWTKPQLKDLFARAGLTAREALRTRNTSAEDLGLTQPGVSEDRILDAMVAEPVLVERPFVVTPKGVALGRPLEKIEALI